MAASIGCFFSGVGFVFRKPLSQILGSSLLLLQEVSHTRPFGGLGLSLAEDAFLEDRDLFLELALPEFEKIF